MRSLDITTDMFDASISSTTQPKAQGKKNIKEPHVCQPNSTLASPASASSSSKAGTLLPINYEAYTEEYGSTHPAYALRRAKGGFRPHSAVSSIHLNLGSERMKMMPGLPAMMEDSGETQGECV